MEKVIERIREDAFGRTCGGCVFYTGAACQAHISLATGKLLIVADPKAPACAEWTDKTQVHTE